MKSFKQFTEAKPDPHAKKIALSDIDKVIKMMNGIEIAIDEGGFDRSDRSDAMKELTVISGGLNKLRKIARKL